MKRALLSLSEVIQSSLGGGFERLVMGAYLSMSQQVIDKH
jgi:hypothetical protein